MSRHQDERPHELESQFILRLPPEHASALREIIRSGSAAMREKLKIDLSPDSRHAVVQVDNVSLSARVVDLPCVIGSLKTYDRKTFYQTADISQMLLCCANGDPCSSAEEVVPSAGAPAMGNEGETEEKKCIWKHGITPPLKNVRKKRFRKPARKLPNMKQNVENEVKRLLRSDAEAISIRWEIVDDEIKTAQSQTLVPGLLVPTAISGPVSSECAVPQNTFCDSSCHDDDQDEEEEEDEDEDEEEEKDDSEEDLERELQAKFIEFSSCKAKEGHSSIILGIQKLIHLKKKKLQEIQGKAQRQKDLLRNLENLTLKSHFQSVLGQLKLQEKQKLEQIIFLQEQLKYFLKK
ncbi:Transcription initiation factor TFIID subunit 7-like [Lemmus lemmus]